jgi:AcrR family transcriptional regulator
MSTRTKKASQQRLSKQGRRQQLVVTARRIVLNEGTDKLSLPYLAEQAGVSRPVVYSHFETRNNLLKAIYEDYDNRRMVVLEAALERGQRTLADCASIIARTYLECVLQEGTDIPGVAAALTGSPELELFRTGYQQRLLSRWAIELAPFSARNELTQAKLLSIIGAADTLSTAAFSGQISFTSAEQEIVRVIMSATQ